MQLPSTYLLGCLHLRVVASDHLAWPKSQQAPAAGPLQARPGPAVNGAWRGLRPGLWFWKPDAQPSQALKPRLW